MESRGGKSRVAAGQHTRDVIEEMLDCGIPVFHRRFENKQEALTFSNRYRRMSQRQEYPIECYCFGLDVYIVNLLIHDKRASKRAGGMIGEFSPTDLHIINAQRKNNGVYYQVAMAFLASGQESIVREFDDEASCKKAYIGFRALLARHPELDICHVKQGRKIYLIRGRRDDAG